MGLLSGGNFADLLEPGLRGIFDKVISRPTPVREQLFGSMSSTKFQEHYLGMGAVGLVEVFDGRVKYDTFDGGWKTTIRNYELVKGMAIERSLVDDDQFNEINRRAQAMGDSFAITPEHDAAQIFINAFTDGGTDRLGASTDGADGVALCSLLHKDSPAQSGNTQANEATLALNIANVDTTRQAMMEFKDDRGQLLGLNPNLILIPAELERQARQIFDPRAVWEPGSAQFDVNIFGGMMRVLIWNRLTDSNAWFMIDSAEMAKSLIFQWRIRPEFDQAQDFDGLIAKYRGYMRYGIGWTDWTWLYGNNPA